MTSSRRKPPKRWLRGFVVLVIALGARPVFANMTKYWNDGERHAPLVPHDSDVRVDAEATPILGSSR